MIYLFNWFTKLTGIMAAHIAFHTKIYYEDRKVQGRRIKGPAIIISNHTAIFDYAVFLFVFFGRTLRYQMAEVLFNKPVLGVVLKMLGGIYVNRNTYDFSFVGKSEAILKKGGVVGIFPEARIPLPDEKRPLPFKTSAAYLARLCPNVPIIPIVTNGEYFSLKKRARVMIGKPIYINDYWNDELDNRENLINASEKLRQHIAGMTKELKKRQERDLLRPPFYYFWFNLIKITAAIPGLVWFRPKTIYSTPEAKKKYKKGVLFFSNHSGMGDPLWVMLGVWYRRVHFVAMQDILDNPKMRFWFEKGFRVIPVDRENVGFNFVKKVSGFLDAGCAVCIFPEGHINISEDRVDQFKNGMILLAIKAKVPLVPLYVQTRKHWYNRQIMFQGEEIDLLKMYGPTPSMAQIEEAGKLCREREIELAKLADEYFSGK